MRLILLRGLGRDRLHWQPLLNQLHLRWPDALVETPDLPGTGDRYQIPSPVQLIDYIPWLEEQLSDSTEPAILAGLSLGGMVALKWAELCPDKFTDVVMINSSSRLSMFYSRLKVFRALRRPAIMCRWSLRIKEQATYNLTCNRQPMPPELLEQWVEIQRTRPVTLNNQVRQAFAALTYQMPEKSTIPPVHVIYSKADRLVDPGCSEALEKYYQSTSYVHSWAGHDLPQDDPEWLVDQFELIASEKESISPVY